MMTDPGSSTAGRERLPPASRTVVAMLQSQSREFGARPLLQIGTQAWRHDEAARAAARHATLLQAAGMAHGERVALMTSNRIELLQVFLGAAWLGAVSVPINTASMGPQIGYFLAHSGARLLVIEESFLGRLEQADLAATALQRIWVVGAGEALPETVDGVACHAYPVASADTAEAAPAAVLPGDTLALIYTSGTTGPAKGVICPHAQYYWWGVNSAAVLGLLPDDVLCTTLPLFHINALNTLAQAMVTGCRVVFETRFSASGFWPSMRQHGATVVYLLGAMVPILLAQPPGAGERAHRVRIGLGPGVPAAAGEAFAARTGVHLLEGYGSTETNFVIATRHAKDDGVIPRRGVMGWLLPGFEARVVDTQDVSLPDGTAGELLLRADEPFAFASGYFGMPDKTIEAWRNLWFHTGDRVLREADGAFRFIDRIKDAIRRRGENISSYEVEQVLLSHPDVATAAVFPVSSELAEDEVMAALVARPDRALDPAELTRFCESRLPYFAIPRYIDIVTDLPRTENGKVQKYKLREQGVSASTWDRQPTAPGRSPQR
jgi:crotonobetaine/carnitine-CoA ligase